MVNKNRRRRRRDTDLVGKANSFTRENLTSLEEHNNSRGGFRSTLNEESRMESAY